MADIRGNVVTSSGAVMCPPGGCARSPRLSVVAAQRGEVSSWLLTSGGVGTQWVLVAVEQGGEFGAVGGAEFGAGAVEVVFHGADRDDQPLGDLPVGQSTGGEGDDFAFSVGEW